jgi:hypothetical protein
LVANRRQNKGFANDKKLTWRIRKTLVTLKRAARLIECTRIEDDCLHDCWRSRKCNDSECGDYQQHSKRHKGEMMKKHCVRILSTFFGLAALAITAKGQAVDQLVVNIPYEFVVAGKTLPAGTYRVSPVSDNNKRVLAISSFENHATVMVLSSEIVDRTSSKQPAISFQQVGEQHLLSKIETAEHVFTIPVSGSAVLQAAMKRHSSLSGSLSE